MEQGVVRAGRIDTYPRGTGVGPVLIRLNIFVLTGHTFVFTLPLIGGPNLRQPPALDN